MVDRALHFKSIPEQSLPIDPQPFVIQPMNGGTDHEKKWARYVGAGVTAVITLLPYIGEWVLVAFVLGTFAAVWFAVRLRGQVLTYNGAAELGFYSGFYGLLAAGSIYGVVWKFFHYELWQLKNADRWVSMFSDMIRDAFNPAVWVIVTIQLIVFAVLAGIIGVPMGLLALKVFQGKAAE